jgi:hypothetical protein
MATTELVTNSVKTAEVVMKDAGTIDKVNQMLLDMMTDVKANPNKIPEAEAMVSLGGRIFEGLKVKVAAAALMVKATQG